MTWLSGFVKSSVMTDKDALIFRSLLARYGPFKLLLELERIYRSLAQQGKRYRPLASALRGFVYIHRKPFQVF